MLLVPPLLPHTRLQLPHQYLCTRTCTCTCTGTCTHTRNSKKTKNFMGDWKIEISGNYYKLHGSLRTMAAQTKITWNLSGDGADMHVPGN